MKILIALDESPHSDRALDFVTRMRWPAGSRVIVLSAVQPVATLAAAQEPSMVLPELNPEQRQRLQTMVSGAECRLRECGFSAEGRIVVGDPREALLQAVQSERADLLVVGSRGRTGLTKLMLGSVSSHVVAHAPCSVLVVKPVGRASAGKEGAS